MDSPDKNEGNASKAGVECTICLSNDAKEIGLLRCKHSFCFECIESWSEHENSCPLCKVRFTFIDKILRDDMQPEGAAKSRRNKHTRVKIKRKNQADYEPAYGGHGNGNDVDMWVNFIASLVGTGNNHFQRIRDSIHLPNALGGGMDYFFHGEHEEFEPRINRGRRRTLGRERQAPRVLQATPRSINIPSSSALPPRRTLATARSSGGSANNPILLSDDEEEMRPAPANPSSRTQSVPDLVDLTDDVEVAASASVRSAFPAPHTPAAAAVEAGGLYDSDDDEDYLEYDDEEENEDDDNSDASSDAEPSETEVIELSDTDSDASDRDEAAAPLVGMPAHRLSGVMVWCRDCDSFHDKQRVWDDRNYCRATYDSLMMTDGFADIVRDTAAAHVPAPAPVLAATVAAPVVNAAEIVASLPAASTGAATAPILASDSTSATAPVTQCLDWDAEWDGDEIFSSSARGARSKNGLKEEAEWDADEEFPVRKPRVAVRRVVCDEDESERDQDSSAGASGEGCGSSSSTSGVSDAVVTEVKEACSLSTRTQSDATTCSSRSRSTAAENVDGFEGDKVVDKIEHGANGGMGGRKRIAQQVDEDSPSKRTRSSTQ